MLLSRLIPGFPNSRFFFEPINRELGGTTVASKYLAQKKFVFQPLCIAKYLGVLEYSKPTSHSLQIYFFSFKRI